MALVWIDCEMTGLDTLNDTIIEIACVVTNAELVVLGTSACVIAKPKAVLDNMNEWCVTHHRKSGLTDRVLASTTTLAEAQAQILSIIKQHVPLPRTAHLSGNSVHMDKMFLMREMPALVDHLHYRIVDVSTIKELCGRWNPDVFIKAPRKKCDHRALDDILESIKELRYYKRAFLRCSQ